MRRDVETFLGPRAPVPADFLHQQRQVMGGRAALADCLHQRGNRIDELGTMSGEGRRVQRSDIGAVAYIYCFVAAEKDVSKFDHRGLVRNVELPAEVEAAGKGPERVNGTTRELRGEEFTANVFTALAAAVGAQPLLASKGFQLPQDQQQFLAKEVSDLVCTDKNDLTVGVHTF